MKLEIGKFIRTPYGIRKIVNITKDDGYGKPKVRVIELDRHLNTPYKFDYIFYTDENVIKKCKTSYNIIDLIEVGDYVNGHKVSKVLIAPLLRELELEEVGYYVDSPEEITEEEIKSILTKEQLEAIQYVVK